MDTSLLKKLKEKYNPLSTEDQLITLSKEYGTKAVFSLGFGKEGMVLADMIIRNELPIRIFTIDTGRLFPETYELFYQMRYRYGSRIEVYFPESKDVERLLEEKGPMSFYDSIENRKECCYIRKLKPLRRALTNARVWITGLRGSQSQFRKGFELFQYHPRHQVVKYNPLIHWTKEGIDEYIQHHRVPVNILHKRGYASIGCAPCTRPVQKGEDERAGRWWWEDSQKECGLHSTFIQMNTEQGVSSRKG